MGMLGSGIPEALPALILAVVPAVSGLVALALPFIPLSRGLRALGFGFIAIIVMGAFGAVLAQGGSGAGLFIQFGGGLLTLLAAVFPFLLKFVR